MKHLIIYYSKTGNNEYLAKEINKRLSCDIEQIIEQKKRTMFTLIKEMIFKILPKIKDMECRVENYDHLILIAPVWGGIVATPLISFITKYLNKIDKYSFISICGGALGENKKLMDYLNKKIGKKPVNFTQLYINNLLPAEKKNKMKFTSSYKIGQNDINNFKKELDQFINIGKHG